MTVIPRAGAFAIIALFAAACATGVRCPKPDLGGWMVDMGQAMDQEYGVQHSCAQDGEQFVLRVAAGAGAWTDLATLSVPLHRGESTMYGFECGSTKGVRDDAIAVVREHRDGTFTVKRAWVVDVKNRRFVPVARESVVCESLE